VLPGKGGAVLESIYKFIANEFGIVYLLASVSCIGLLVWLACSRFGHIRLASDDAPPEFSTLNWIAMLFCSGIGAGLLFWCVIEWSYYYSAPPFGVTPRTNEAAEWASTYGIFHWGFTAWAFYCLPSIAIAYPYYVKKIQWLRFSNSCNRFLRGRELGVLSRFIDFWLMIAIIAGAGSALAFCTPMISACLAWLFGLEYGFWLDLVVIGLSVLIFGTSVWLGLKKGMKTLSDLTLVLGLLLLLYVLFAGPTDFLLRTSLNSVGLMLQNFVRMNFWTDPFARSGFVENWTIFYWAWWMAYGPFVGIFVTRISHGRTIRNVIGGMLTFGSIGGALFFIVLGNYALNLELTGALDVTGLMKSVGEAQAITAVISSLPWGTLVLATFTVVALLLLVTTYDSASYTLASVSTMRLEAGHDPARWNRVFWACALGVLPITLMFIDGGLKVILSATIVCSLPLLAVGVLMVLSLLKMLREDEALDRSPGGRPSRRPA